jgi:predicted RNA binding protein YcfA (HicA-like mRNA interferase family)
MKREGGSHSIYWNPNTGRREPVPRHAEVPDLLARKICRALEIPEP